MNKFASQVLDWFAVNGRHDLPWQHNRSAYRVWVSEIMLQQTQVITVIPYFEKFMQRFPDIATLANSTLDEVLHHWSGLGYYARARNMHKAAQMLNQDYQNQIPEDLELLMQLPGIGRSTAGAILALASSQRQPILDGNVKRVLTRYHAIEGYPGQAKIEKALWKLAEKHTPFEKVAEYTQAIMDLGATVCVRSEPKCLLCPLNKGCRARQKNKQYELPTPRSKKQLPVRKTIFLILLNEQGKLLFEKRPPSGIWGGLWSFPECEKNTDVRCWIRDNLGYSVKDIFRQPVIRHTFSHFHLDITPMVIHIGIINNTVRENGSRHWYHRNNINKIGIPTPVKKILGKLNEQNGILRKTG